MELRYTATSLIRSPRYYGHFLWPHGKNVHTFPWKETLVNFDHLVITATFYGRTANTSIHFLEKKLSLTSITSLLRPIFCPLRDRNNGVPLQSILQFLLFFLLLLSSFFRHLTKYYRNPTPLISHKKNANQQNGDPPETQRMFQRLSIQRQQLSDWSTHSRQQQLRFLLDPKYCQVGELPALALSNPDGGKRREK